MFNPSDKVMLYDLRLCLCFGKLHSRWWQPFIIKAVYLHSAIEIEYPEIDHIFKVNGKKHKYFLEFPNHMEETNDLVNPLTSLWHELNNDTMYIIVLTLCLFWYILCWKPRWYLNSPLLFCLFLTDLLDISIHLRQCVF